MPDHPNDHGPIDDTSPRVGAPNGASVDAIAGDPDDGGVDDYELLVTLDQLEEIIESFDELGGSTRADLLKLPTTPEVTDLLRDLERHNLQSRAEAEARLAELEADTDEDFA